MPASPSTDDLSGLLDDAAYDGNAAATAGSVSFASPGLAWTGDLAPGVRATVTFTATVNNPDTGNRSLATAHHLGRRREQLPGRQAPTRPAPPSCWWRTPRC